MKKLLGLAVILALVSFCGQANAELFKNLKATGSLDLQGVSAQNLTDFSTHGGSGLTSANDRVGTMMTRVIAGLAWDLLDDVHAKITLRKNDRAWGSNGNHGQGSDDGNSESIDGGSGVLGNIYVNEAYVKIDKLFGALDTKLGRQFWGEPGDLIAFWGPTNTYGLYASALDAATVEYSNDRFSAWGVAGKWHGTPIGATAADDVAEDWDVTGIGLGTKNLPVKAEVFVWNRFIHANGPLGQPPQQDTWGLMMPCGVNDYLWVYGLKLKGEGMGAWAKATLALNGGTYRNFNGWWPPGWQPSGNYIGKGLLVDLGYKADVPAVGGFAPWANFGWGSGRHDGASKEEEGFRPINSDYRPGVIYGRFGLGSALTLGQNLGGGFFEPYDFAYGVSYRGLQNRIIWGAGLKYTPAPLQKATVGVSYWDFNYQYATLVPADMLTTAAEMASGTLGAGNRHIGSEFDLQVDWAHSQNVALDAGWAFFMPGGFIKEYNGQRDIGTNPVSMLFTDVGIKF